MEEIIISPHYQHSFQQWTHGGIAFAMPKPSPPILGRPVNCYSNGVLPLQCFIEYLHT